MKQQEINKLLDQYRLGIISEADRQKLEQLSVEDDFVFTALEGMNEEKKSKGEPKDMDVLRTRLLNKVTEKKNRKTLPFWIPGAAAAILLIVAGLWIFNPSNNLEDKAIFAKVNKVEGKPSSTKGANDQEKDIAGLIDQSNSGIEDDNLEKTSKKESIASEEKKITPNKEIATNSSTSLESPPAVMEEEEIEEMSSPSEILQYEYLSANEGNAEESYSEDRIEEDLEVLQGDLNTEYSPERKTSSPVAAKAKKEYTPAENYSSEMVQVENEASVVYKGVITDNYNQPIIGASILIKGTTKEYSTDFEGKVEITDLTIKNPRAVISYIGYNDIEITLTEEFFVQLQEGAVLDEVVVVSAGSTASSQPEMGWDKFNNLVETTFQSQNSQSNIQIDFTVGQNGNPTDFKIIKGEDNPLSMMIINLIKTSGKWSPGAGTYIY